MSGAETQCMHPVVLPMVYVCAMPPAASLIYVHNIDSLPPTRALSFACTDVDWGRVDTMCVLFFCIYLGACCELLYRRLILIKKQLAASHRDKEWAKLVDALVRVQ
jgi:hypothetical protein